MARKSTKRRRVQKPNVVAWSEVFSKFFRMGGCGDWTPPATVSCRQTLRGFTFVAVFQDQHGQPVRLTTRVAWVRGEDRFTVLDEQMSISVKCGAGAAQ
jgi:hypothetical protein